MLAGIVAFVSVVGTVGAAHAHPGPRPLDAGAVLLALVPPVAIAVLVARWPRTAALTGAGATWAYLALGYAWGPILGGAVLLLAALLLAGPVRRARVVAAGGAVLLTGAVLAGAAGRHEGHSAAGLLAGVAWSAVALLVASGVRERTSRFAERRADAARSRAERQSTAVAAERLRIAREMHDVLAHSLSAITVQAGVGLHLLDRDPEQARTALTHIRSTSIEALDEVRAVLGVVRAGGGPDGEVPLAPTWTLAALARLVALAGTERLTATLTVDESARDLPDRLSGVVYRVVQEALTNIRRHAPDATRASVRVDVAGAAEGRRLTVTVDDDGAPGQAATAVPSSGAGYGLLGMRERVHGVGGTIEVGPIPGGWRVRAAVPWPAARPTRASDTPPMPDAPTEAL